VDIAAVLVFWRRQKSLANAGIRTRDRPARSLVTIPTELSRHHKLSPVLNLSSLHRKVFWVLIFSFYLNPKLYGYGHTTLRYDILSHIYSKDSVSIMCKSLCSSTLQILSYHKYIKINIYTQTQCMYNKMSSCVSKVELGQALPM